MWRDVYTRAATTGRGWVWPDGEPRLARRESAGRPGWGDSRIGAWTELVHAPRFR